MDKLEEKYANLLASATSRAIHLEIELEEAREQLAALAQQVEDLQREA